MSTPARPHQLLSFLAVSSTLRRLYVYCLLLLQLHCDLLPTPFVMYPTRLAFTAFSVMLSRVESYVQLENWKPHCCSSNGNLGGRANVARITRP